GFVFYWLLQLSEYSWFTKMCDSIAGVLPVGAVRIGKLFIYAIPVMACFFFVDRPLRFALCVAVILRYTTYRDDAEGSVCSERSFFGILKVEDESTVQRTHFTTEDGKFIPFGRIEFTKLVHGTTLHGTQIRKMDNNVTDMFQAMTALNS